MRRLLLGARWVWRHPLVWLLPSGWGLLTWLLYDLTPLVVPVHRFGSQQDSIPGWSVADGISANGNVFVTAPEDHFGWGRRSGYPGREFGGPVCVWNVREGRMIRQFAAKDDQVLNLYLSPDGAWLSMRRNRKTEIYLVDGGERFAFDDDDYGEPCPANSGRWVVYRHKQSLERFDPRSQIVATILDFPDHDFKHPHRGLIQGLLHGFSQDDRWLVIQPCTDGSESHLVLLDIETGSVAAKLDITALMNQRKLVGYPWAIRDAKITRDKKALGFTLGADLIVLEIATGKCVLSVPNVAWLGWDASQKNVIVHRYRNRFVKDGEPSRLESWSAGTGERRHYWEIPSEPVVPMYSSFRAISPAPWDDGLPALSPDGSRMVWASYHSTITELGPDERDRDTDGRGHVFFQEGKPKRCRVTDCHYLIRLMSTRDFSELARWRIEVDDEPSVTPTLKWCPVGHRLFLSDDHVVEIWRASPRSLSQSAGIAMAPTWLLGCSWYLLSCWRSRRRDTISRNAGAA
jgi:hypothetical protein